MVANIKLKKFYSPYLQLLIQDPIGPHRSVHWWQKPVRCQGALTGGGSCAFFFYWAVVLSEIQVAFQVYKSVRAERTKLHTRILSPNAHESKIRFCKAKLLPWFSI